MQSPQAFIAQHTERASGRLFSAYMLFLACYTLSSMLAMALGIEPIYGNVTPFYAVGNAATHYQSVNIGALAAALLLVTLLCAALGLRAIRKRSLLLVTALTGIYALIALPSDVMRQGMKSADFIGGFQWFAPAMIVIGIAFLVTTRFLRAVDPVEGEFEQKYTRKILIALILFSFLFAGAIAMFREGTAGIAAAYSRAQYEYVDDIGKGLTLYGFLGKYNEMHALLSMHAKVHPPGPVVMLWLLSMVLLSRDALTLSLGTMFIGSLAIIPLYAWVRDMLGQRVALICCVFYTLMPSIVLFTATSADIMFLPLLLTTLFLFWRAIHRNSVAYAVGAGILYALCSLTSFSLLTVGAFFGFVGIWQLFNPGARIAVVKTAVMMSVSFLAFHALVRFGTGFDIIECFRLSHAQFLDDQLNVDLTMPRYPSWAFKIFNPLCWVYFAGLPTTLLFVWRIAKPEANTKTLFLIFAATLLVIAPLYLARGEGERSAMYVLPFIVVPAAHALNELVRSAKSFAPLAVTFLFLMLQAWLTETFLYTYW